MPKKSLLDLASENKGNIESRELNDRLVIDIRDPDFMEVEYLANLRAILDDIQAGSNPNKQLHCLLRATAHLLDRHQAQAPTEIRTESYKKFIQIKHLLMGGLLDKKLERHFLDMATGQFIQGLMHFGMPRDPAIKATAKWLCKGHSTIRTYHEKYKKEYAENFVTEANLLILIPFSRQIIWDLIENNDNFPCDHVKAKPSFEKLKNYIQKENEEYASSAKYTHKLYEEAIKELISEN